MPPDHHGLNGAGRHERHDPRRRAPAALGHLRLQLLENPSTLYVGGLWAPYSYDLTREAAHLVDEFPASRGRVDRLAYAPGEWQVVAQEVFTRHGRVKVGFLPPRDGQRLVLLGLVGSEVLRIAITWSQASDV